MRGIAAGFGLSLGLAGCVAIFGGRGGVISGVTGVAVISGVGAAVGMVADSVGVGVGAGISVGGFVAAVLTVISGGGVSEGMVLDWAVAMAGAGGTKPK